MLVLQIGTRPWASGLRKSSRRFQCVKCNKRAKQAAQGTLSNCSSWSSRSRNGCQQWRAQLSEMTSQVAPLCQCSSLSLSHTHTPLEQLALLHVTSMRIHQCEEAAQHTSYTGMLAHTLVQAHRYARPRLSSFATRTRKFLPNQVVTSMFLPATSVHNSSR